MAPEPAVEPLAEYLASHSSYKVQVSEFTMIACRSPLALLPPSMGVSGPNGYLPR
jgi:hypothetical protein